MKHALLPTPPRRSPFSAADWLAFSALPLWASSGIDRETGGAVEALDHAGRPLRALDRRIRVQPRQAYVFAGAGRFLQRADYLDLSEALLAFGLSQRSADGWLPARTQPCGTPVDHVNALYDLAFFVLAGAELTLAGRAQDALWPWLHAMLDAMKAPRGWYENRFCGTDGAIRTQNSHMHLYEAACLASHATRDPRWQAVADECLALFETVFLTPEGMVLEFFDNALAPVSQGQQVEPGHGAEWIYLLDQGARTVGHRPRTDTDLMFRAMLTGRDGSGLLRDAMTSRTRRLWPQTEFLKACLVREAAGRPMPAGLSSEGVLELIAQDYLAAEVPGGWYDRRGPGGELLSTTMPTSSLYHIYVAFRSLEALA